MATYNGNDVYLEWDGVDISGYWTGEVNENISVNTQEITAGAGVDHVQRAIGLIDRTMTFTVTYDDTDLGTYKSKLVEGTKATLIYGPEGQATGKPKFEGTMILQAVDHTVSIEKEMVAFELSFEQADAPVSTIAGGGVF